MSDFLSCCRRRCCCCCHNLPTLENTFGSLRTQTWLILFINQMGNQGTKQRRVWERLSVCVCALVCVHACGWMRVCSEACESKSGGKKAVCWHRSSMKIDGDCLTRAKDGVCVCKRTYLALAHPPTLTHTHTHTHTLTHSLSLLQNIFSNMKFVGVK